MEVSFRLSGGTQEPPVAQEVFKKKAHKVSTGQKGESSRHSDSDPQFLNIFAEKKGNS